LVKKEESKSMRDVALEEIKEYAAKMPYFSTKRITVELEKTQTSKLFEDIEIPLVPVLAAMETEGINLDVLSPQKNMKCKGNRHFRTKNI
jgi:DNA polymerase-1